MTAGNVHKNVARGPQGHVAGTYPGFQEWSDWEYCYSPLLNEMLVQGRLAPAIGVRAPSDLGGAETLLPEKIMAWVESRINRHTTWTTERALN